MRTHCGPTAPKRATGEPGQEANVLVDGGRTGIRTQERVAPLAVFKADFQAVRLGPMRPESARPALLLVIVARDDFSAPADGQSSSSHPPRLDRGSRTPPEPRSRTFGPA